jgi:hypothetical protein
VTAPKDAAPADAALDALAAALLPRLARLARADAPKDYDRSSLVELLDLAGYEIDEAGGEPLLAPRPPRKAGAR